MPTELLAASALLPTHPAVRCSILADAIVDAARTLDRAARCDVTVMRLGGVLHVAGRMPEIDLAAILGEPHRTTTSPGMPTTHAIARGTAIDEPGTNYLPAETWLAAHLASRLAELAAEGGEVVVLLEADEHPLRLAGFSCALAEPTLAVQRGVRAILQDELSHLARRVPGFDSRVPESIAIHPFEPPTVAISDVLCGKDLAHPVRGGAILARRLAKAVVQTGAARVCRVVLTFVPGMDDGMIVGLDGERLRLDASRWGDLVDRSLTRLAERCGAVSLAEVTRAGMFLREDWPWEAMRW